LGGNSLFVFFFADIYGFFIKLVFLGFQPKGVVRDNGGHAVALNWSMRHIYDMQPGDVYWAASDIGFYM